MTTSPTRIGLACVCVAFMLVAGFPRVAHPQDAIVGSITGKVFDGDNTPLPNVVVKAHAMTSNRSLASATTNERGSFLIPDAPASIYALTLTHEGVDYPVSQRIDARAGMTFLLDNCLRLDKRTKTAAVIPGDCAGELIAQAKVVTIGPHRFLAATQEGEPLSLFDAEPGELAEPGETTETDPDLDDPGVEAPAEEAMEPQSAGPDITEPDPDPEPDADVTYQPLEDESELAGIDTDAPGLQIEHEELECLQHDRFPLVDSMVRPGPNVAVCRVYFRSDKYPDFYYVEATEIPETPEDFRAILPKPSPETERVIYYVEAVNEAFEIFQTAENDPEVVDDPCRDERAAYYEGEAPSIVVGATTAGAAAVPPGFQALGITSFISAAGVTTAVTAAAAAGGAAAGAGLSTGLIVVVSGAAVAGGGAIVNNVVNNDEASTP